MRQQHLRIASGIVLKLARLYFRHVIDPEGTFDGAVTVHVVSETRLRRTRYYYRHISTGHVRGGRLLSATCGGRQTDGGFETRRQRSTHATRRDDR